MIQKCIAGLTKSLIDTDKANEAISAYNRCYNTTVEPSWAGEVKHTSIDTTIDLTNLVTKTFGQSGIPDLSIAERLRGFAGRIRNMTSSIAGLDDDIEALYEDPFKVLFRVASEDIFPTGETYRKGYPRFVWQHLDGVLWQYQTPKGFGLGRLETRASFQPQTLPGFTQAGGGAIPPGAENTLIRTQEIFIWDEYISANRKYYRSSTNAFKIGAVTVVTYSPALYQDPVTILVSSNTYLDSYNNNAVRCWVSTSPGLPNQLMDDVSGANTT